MSEIDLHPPTEEERARWPASVIVPLETPCPAPQSEGSQGVDEGNVVDILAGLPTDRLPLYDDY